MKQHIVTIFVAATAGAASAITAVWAYGVLHAAPDETQQKHEPAKQVAFEVANMPQRLAAENTITPETMRMANLPGAQSERSIAQEQNEDLAAPPPDPAVERASYVQEERDFLSEHQREGRDERWAAAAEHSLSTTLTRIADGSFRVGRVDCKTTRCTATVTFPNRMEGKKRFPELLHTAYEPNCGRAILLPEAQVGEGAITATLRFDCEEARVAEYSPSSDSTLNR